MKTAKQKIGTKQQIEAVILSPMGLDEGARVLWVYLATCSPGGRSPGWLRENLGLMDFDAAATILVDARLARMRSGKLVPLPMLVVAREEDRETPEPSPLREIAEVILDVYNQARRAAGVHAPAERSEKVIAKLEELAEWLADGGIEAEAWVQFAIERSAGMRGERFQFVPLHILTGPWLREEWTITPTKQKAGKHAGKDYGRPDQTRALLIHAGFESMEDASDEIVGHVRDWAESMLFDPVGVPDTDPEYDGEIRWLRANLERERSKKKREAR